jgi:hypothetical protein
MGGREGSKKGKREKEKKEVACPLFFSHERNNNSPL